ncbi:hypothetical protein MITS9504_02454 [Synechococcus sp. MIT S9504]|nr:hypothetical protein MITS9504_02454 [Synechococcus sp. MIT S9504]
MISSHKLNSHTYYPALAREIAQLIANPYGKGPQGFQKELRR